MPESSDNFAYTLARIRWDLFGTLTFRGRVPRSSIAFGHAWRHLRHAAKLTGQPYARLLIALRQELGELNAGSTSTTCSVEPKHTMPSP